MIKKDEVGRACSTHGEKHNVYMILMEKPEGKRPLGRHKCKWKDNIKMDLREIGWGDVDLIDMAQNMDQLH
jgi:hypothetical protein